MPWALVAGERGVGDLCASVHFKSVSRFRFTVIAIDHDVEITLNFTLLLLLLLMADPGDLSGIYRERTAGWEERPPCRGSLSYKVLLSRAPEYSLHIARWRFLPACLGFCLQLLLCRPSLTVNTSWHLRVGLCTHRLSTKSMDP
jgi:hypothetical protein